MSKYSGKMLCDVPEEELYVGMRVISLVGTPGKITGFRLPPEDRYLSINFKWDSGKESFGVFHMWPGITVQ